MASVFDRDSRIYILVPYNFVKNIIDKTNSIKLKKKLINNTLF